MSGASVDWIWISLLALWERWWPDRVCLELLDDKMQAGYDQDAENGPRAAAVTWLGAWSDVLRLCDATGIGSIGGFDDRFPLTQSLYNWSQDLEMALENAGRDDGEMRQALIEFCEESFRRFPHEDQLLTENRRRTMAQAYFDAGMTKKAEELLRRGYRVAGVQDRVFIAERLREVCEDGGRRRRPEAPRGRSRWDAMPCVRAAAGRSSRSAAAPRS